MFQPRLQSPIYPCVLSCPPFSSQLLLSARAVIWDESFIKTGTLSSRAPWHLNLFKMNRAGQCEFHWPECFICSREDVKASGSPLPLFLCFFFLFYCLKHAWIMSGKESEGCAVLCQSLRLPTGSCSVPTTFGNVCTVFPH